MRKNNINNDTPRRKTVKDKDMIAFVKLLDFQYCSSITSKIEHLAINYLNMHNQKLSYSKLYSFIKRYPNAI
jgi:hypothetical protein